MGEHAIISPPRGLGRLLSCAGLAALAISGPAYANVALEYGQDYQDIYLAACAARQAPDLCTCEVEAIEDAVSFEVFADAVQRSGGDLRKSAIWSSSASAIDAACRGARDEEDE